MRRLNRDRRRMTLGIVSAGACVLSLAVLSGQDDPLLKGEPLAEVIARTQKEKPGFAKRQQDLLAARYDLTDRPATGVTMTRGKAVQDGVRVKLSANMTWDQLAALSPDEIRKRNAWPGGFLPLPHPHHEAGGMIFPKPLIDETIKQTARDLTRFDLDFDLPDHLLPEFPAPVFLVTRPDLGDVSKGELITLDNFERLFKEILNPKQLEGLRLLVTPFPQQQFNLTDGPAQFRKPHQGVTCFDCHANGHTNAATHTVGDIRPQRTFRHRIDTPTLRGVGVQRLFGSQRALKSVEDFTEFEQRAAYFDGDHTRAARKGRQPSRAGQPGALHGRVSEPARLPAGAEADVLGQPRPGDDKRGGAAGRSTLLWQSAVLGLPPGAVLHRQLDAQPEDGTVLQAASQSMGAPRQRTDRSRRFRSAASRTHHPTCTTTVS